MFFFPCLFDYFIFVILLNDSYVFPKDTWTSFGMDDKLTLPGFLRFWMRGLDDCGDLPSWENQWQITSKLPPLRLIALFISYIWYVFFYWPFLFSLLWSSWFLPTHACMLPRSRVCEQTDDVNNHWRDKLLWRAFVGRSKIQRHHLQGFYDQQNVAWPFQGMPDKLSNAAYSFLL